MKASAIRTHAATARSEFEALLAEADVIETSYRLVSMKDKKAFDTCALNMHSCESWIKIRLFLLLLLPTLRIIKTRRF